MITCEIQQQHGSDHDVFFRKLLYETSFVKTVILCLIIFKSYHHNVVHTNCDELDNFMKDNLFQL